MSKILFTEEAASFILKAFHLQFNENNEVVDEKGELMRSSAEEIITKDNFGGIMKGENGQLVFITSALFEAKVVDMYTDPGFA